MYPYFFTKKLGISSINGVFLDISNSSISISPLLTKSINCLKIESNSEHIVLIFSKKDDSELGINREKPSALNSLLRYSSKNHLKIFSNLLSNL